MADEMLKGEGGVTTYHYGPAGEAERESVLKHAVYWPIRIGNTFWSIVVATPENEVLLAMSGFRSKFLLITLALLVFSTIFTYLLVRSQIIIREQKKREPIVQALEESEESFRRIFDESSDPILLLKDNAFSECNRAALAMLGNIPARSPHPFHAGGHFAAPAAGRFPVGRAAAAERIRDGLCRRASALRVGPSQGGRHGTLRRRFPDAHRDPRREDAACGLARHHRAQAGRGREGAAAGRS